MGVKSKARPTASLLIATLSHFSPTALKAWGNLHCCECAFLGYSCCLSHLLELVVPLLDDEDDPGVGVEDDEQGEKEGTAGRVDDVADVLVVRADPVLLAVIVL